MVGWNAKNSPLEALFVSIGTTPEYSSPRSKSISGRDFTKYSIPKSEHGPKRAEVDVEQKLTLSIVIVESPRGGPPFQILRLSRYWDCLSLHTLASNGFREHTISTSQ